MSQTAAIRGSAGAVGATRSVVTSAPAPSPAIRQRLVANGIATAIAASASASRPDRRRQRAEEHARGFDGALETGEVGCRDGRAERKARAAHPGGDCGDGDGRDRVERATAGSSDRLKSERDEPEQTERREQGAGQEREAGASFAPREREPGGGDCGVEECEAQ